MTVNKLKLNESKTEFFIAASQHNLAKLSDTTIRIGSEDITPSTTIRNLGVIFDSNMNMSSQVTSLCRSINFTLWNTSRVRRFIDQDSCNHAMRALILSKLDYANSLLSGCSMSNITRLQRLQNRSARIIFQVAKHHSSAPLLKTLHWLPVDKRIAFKTLLHVHKSLNGQAPAYLTDCLSVYIPGREGLRSANDTTRLVTPTTHRLVGSGSFSVSGPKLWNDLPPTIRSCNNITAFKCQLKTHLFC